MYFDLFSSIIQLLCAIDVASPAWSLLPVINRSSPAIRCLSTIITLASLSLLVLFHVFPPSFSFYPAVPCFCSMPNFTFLFPYFFVFCSPGSCWCLQRPINTGQTWEIMHFIRINQDLPLPLVSACLHYNLYACSFREWYMGSVEFTNNEITIEKKSRTLPAGTSRRMSRPST